MNENEKYRVIVDTETEAAPLTGTQTRASPSLTGKGERDYRFLHAG